MESEELKALGHVLYSGNPAASIDRASSNQIASFGCSLVAPNAVPEA